MDDNNIVKMSRDYLLERCDGEHIVYHPTLETSMYLNDTGAIIWQLCDGTRTVAEIIAVLADCYPESRHDIGVGVKELLVKLVDKQIATLV